MSYPSVHGQTTSQYSRNEKKTNRLSSDQVHEKKIIRSSSNQDKAVWSPNDSAETSKLPSSQKKIIWPLNYWKKRSQSLSDQRKTLHPSIHAQRINQPSNNPEKTSIPSSASIQVKRRTIVLSGVVLS